MDIKKINLDINKIFLISDIHFGIRNNSNVWLEIQMDYFKNFYIPLLNKYKEKDDVIFCLGDVFDSRQFLNINVLNKVLDIFEELSKILPIYIIAGNHDIFNRNSNKINSLRVFEKFDNIHIISSEILLINERFALMPWVEDKTIERDIIKNLNSEYLFCHTDFSNAKYTHKMNVDVGNHSIVFSRFKKVYSGHIHFTQSFDNINLIGCPYHLTRNDIGNDKYVFILDTKTGEEISIKNNYTPRFVSVSLDRILGMMKDKNKYKNKLNFIFKNNFVDIIVSQEQSVSFDFSSFYEKINEYSPREVNYIIQSNDIVQIENIDGDVLNSTNLLDFIRFYIDNNLQDISDNFKNHILEYSKKLYNKIISENKDSDFKV